MESIKPKHQKILPTFQCYSCGNCEANYHNDPSANTDNGFCMRFKENVDLEEKNIRCWTSKPHTYFEDLSKLSPLANKENLHKLDKRAKHLKIELNNNQLNLFL